jgi:hypothetical protein
MNRGSDTEHPNLVHIAVIVTFGAAIVVVLCLLFAGRSEKPQGFDYDLVTSLEEDAKKHLDEASETYLEAMQFDAGSAEREGLLKVGYQKCEKAMEIVKQIEKYYRDHDREPPWPPLPSLPPDDFITPPLRPPLEPPPNGEHHGE